jgi:hypothetical protein
LRAVARLLSWLRGPDDRVVIDQDAARRIVDEHLQAYRHRCMERYREQRRTSMQVGAWAQQSVAVRRKMPFPGNIRRAMPAWLQGLSGQELLNLSKASREEIRNHVYDGKLVPGVRPVQPLAAQDPIFPLPVLPADILNDREGGGRRMKRLNSSGFSSLGGRRW